MNKLPSFLQKNNQATRSVCLILEGYEEFHYFQRLLQINVFSNQYSIKLINAKSASNIPAKYQETFNSNSFSIVLIVCDMDREPAGYDRLISKLKSITENIEDIVFFVRPCILQIILIHFGNVELSTQAKKVARPDVQRLTGVKNYDAHEDQLREICSKIFHRHWDEMYRRLELISTNREHLPSTNIKQLFDYLMSSDVSWIQKLNDRL